MKSSALSTRVLPSVALKDKKRSRIRDKKKDLNRIKLNLDMDHNIGRKNGSADDLL